MKKNIKKKENIINETILNKDLIFREPENIKFLKNLTNDSIMLYSLDNSFSIFKSINDIFYLVYSKEEKSIISYNLNDNRKINEIKNAHEELITNLRYYLDKTNKRDLILSISARNNNLKLWNMNIFECLLNLQNINLDGELYSACLLNDNNHIYIITIKYDFIDINSELIKVFDLKGNKIKEINDSEDKSFYVDTYYDNKSSINYIITGNEGHIKSYNYNQNKIYHMYFDINDCDEHRSIKINLYEDIIKLIDSCLDGNIRIWDFHTGQLINKIKISDNWLYGICLWNNDYIFVGSSDKLIKMVKINTGEIIKELNGYNDYVLTLKKIFLPEYGECLISQGFGKEQIKLWINN